MKIPTPEGYNENDYRKLVAFLEQTDDEGVKNGEKLSDNYDPNAPETWKAGYPYSDEIFWIETEAGLRLKSLDTSHWFPARSCGVLDLSGCTQLKHLNVAHGNLSSLNVKDCTALVRLDCDDNHLTELDVSGCTALEKLHCNNNHLTELDLSDCAALKGLFCRSNNLTSLDVSGCPQVHCFCDYKVRLSRR